MEGPSSPETERDSGGRGAALAVPPGLLRPRAAPCHRQGPCGHPRWGGWRTRRHRPRRSAEALEQPWYFRIREKGMFESSETTRAAGCDADEGERIHSARRVKPPRVQGSRRRPPPPPPPRQIGISSFFPPRSFVVRTQKFKPVFCWGCGCSSVRQMRRMPRVTVSTMWSVSGAV